MGYFDWIFQYKFENEKATLIDLREHTLGWYNQLTEPLMPVLKEIEFRQPPQNVGQYVEIAHEIYAIKIMSGHGDNLDNVLKSMNPRGIPFFAPRRKLKTLAIEFQHRGLFVKELAMDLNRWAQTNGREQEQLRTRLFEGWKGFEAAKDNLIDEINHQIQSLG